MNKKVTQVASSSGSPMAAKNEKPAETKEQSTGFATSPATELLQAQLSQHRKTVARLTAQLKGVEQAIGIAKAKASAVEIALLALSEQAKSANKKLSGGCGSAAGQTQKGN